MQGTLKRGCLRFAVVLWPLQAVHMRGDSEHLRCLCSYNVYLQKMEQAE